MSDIYGQNNPTSFNLPSSTETLSVLDNSKYIYGASLAETIEPSAGRPFDLIEIRANKGNFPLDDDDLEPEEHDKEIAQLNMEDDDLVKECKDGLDDVEENTKALLLKLFTGLEQFVSLSKKVRNVYETVKAAEIAESKRLDELEPTIVEMVSNTSTWGQPTPFAAKARGAFARTPKETKRPRFETEIDDKME